MDNEVYKKAHRKINGRQIYSDSRCRILNEVTCGAGNTALHVATTAGNHNYVKNILETSSEPATLLLKTNFLGETALHIAARLGPYEVVNLIMSFAKKEGERRGNGGEFLVDFLAMENQEKDTALHEAVRYNNFEIVKLLIEENPRLGQVVNAASESPLFIAIDRKFYKIARYIMESCLGFSLLGRNGMTVMHAAIIRLDCHYGEILNGYLPSTFWGKLLSFLGHIVCSVFELILGGLKPSWEPSKNGEDFVKDLLGKCGAEILEVADDYGSMPLHYAARLGNEKIVEQFLNKNRFLAYIKDNDGMSALHITAVNGRNASARALLETCPDICELSDKRGQTALHAAARTGQARAVCYLLCHDYFKHLINQKDFEGNTAMHLAAIYGHYKIVKELAQHKRADKGAINAAGMTVIDIIKTSTELDKERKALLINTLKAKGLHQSLERRLKKVTTKETKKKRPEFQEQEDENLFGKNNVLLPEFKENMANINLLVATIIASITFSAAVTAMPGGYDDTDGLAILRTKSTFRYFLVFDSLAFACAAASICIHFFMVVIPRFIHVKYSYPFKSVLALTLTSIISSVLAFVEGTNAVLNHRSDTGIAAKITLIFFFCSVVIFFIRIAFLQCQRLVLYAKKLK